MKCPPYCILKHANQREKQRKVPGREEKEKDT